MARMAGRVFAVAEPRRTAGSGLFLLVVSSVADAGLVTADSGRMSGGALVSVQVGC